MHFQWINCYLIMNENLCGDRQYRMSVDPFQKGKVVL